MRGNTALAYEYDAEPEPELIEIPVEQRKTLLQLNEKTCHWPVGDPGSTDFFFCGGDTANDLPYCSFHSPRSLSADQRSPARQAAVPELIAALISMCDGRARPGHSLFKGMGSRAVNSSGRTGRPSA